MEGYIPGRYVMFCLKEGVTWIKARCYHSQRKYDVMYEVKVAITSEYSCQCCMFMWLGKQGCGVMLLAY